MATTDSPTRRAAVLAVSVTAGLVLYEWAMLSTGFAKYFADTLEHRGALAAMPRLIGVTALMAAQALFFYASLLAGWRWRLLYFALFTIATFVEFGFYRATGAFAGASDLVAAARDTRLWTTVGLHAIDWRAVWPAAAYGLALVATRPTPGHRPARAAAGVLLVFVALHSTYAIAGYARKDVEVAFGEYSPPMLSAQSFARSVVFAGWGTVEAWLRYEPRRAVARLSTETPRRHVVLVVDESVRADHLSVNGYARATTPWLAQLAGQDRIANWGIAASATNASYSDSQCLMTGVSVLPDPERKRFLQPTIFQYAKALNYTTHLYDAEDYRGRAPFSRRDLENSVDDLKGRSDFGEDVDGDFRAARAVARLLDEPRGQFVVLFKRGNHYPYDRNYPQARTMWTPPGATGPDAGTQLINGYDNALAYNIDRFFRNLLRADGSRPDTVILYTSDHGDSFGLMADGWRTFSWESFAVPLMMFGDDRPPVDTSYRASHHNIFPTLLDLLGVPAEARQGVQARSLLSARRDDRDVRVVFSGDPSGRDAFQTADFDSLRPAASRTR